MHTNVQKPATNAVLSYSAYFAVLSLIGFVAFPPSVRAATLCVDQHSKPGCVTTITAAVAAAVAGDTISVAPGTYSEDVVLGKSLSLVGQDRETTIIDAAGHSNGIYIDGLDNANLSDVTVTGFTVENANFEGILANSVGMITIWGNTVRGNDRNLQPSIPSCPNLPAFETSEAQDCGEGIHLIGVDHSTVAYNDVEQNAGGILVSDETATSHANAITHNFVRDNAYAGGITVASHPGYLPTSATGIFENSISGNESIHNGFGGGAGGAGVGFYALGLNNRVYSNEVDGNRLIGNSLPGIAIRDEINANGTGRSPNPDLNNNVIVNNYIAGNGPDPNAPTTVPTGISIFGLTPVVDTVVSGNFIEDENIDVAFNSASTLEIHLNTFLGRIGVDSLNPSANINATENWWGCPAGPGGRGCATTTGTSVVYTPWLTGPIDGPHVHDWDRDCDHDFDHFRIFGF
jgi:hypothetical protein